VVVAVDHTRRRLEAERGALREAELGRSSQDRRDQTHCRDTRLHGQTSAPPMRPQRTIPLIVPGGTRFFGRQSRRRAAGSVQVDRDSVELRGERGRIASSKSARFSVPPAMKVCGSNCSDCFLSSNDIECALAFGEWRKRVKKIRLYRKD
jgi:hypothetical protein